MKFLTKFLALVPALVSSLAAGQDWSNNSTDPIEPAPAPWTLRGTVYGITLLPASPKLPVKAYAPLERTSNFTEGEYVGILGMIQIVRYTESPVGPYDELLIIPGYFKYDREGHKTQKRVRVSRIYVSQKYTAWNGRTNWNIPKHLARFDWSEDKFGTTTLKLYPHDTTGDATEASPAKKPWFQMKFSDAVTGIVNIPFSAELYNLVGINATLVQPPLPQGEGVHGELPGTNHWAATVPGQASSHTTLGLFDLHQGEGDKLEGKDVNAVGDEFFPNFWPGLPRYNIGLRLADAKITFSDPEIWDS
ncbi:hypothetical protein GGS20DRAFT_330314 [Poronia punctata]|nr:hypothetical protein GGS20DRAFT_330314 [Poronia punctata]